MGFIPLPYRLIAIGLLIAAAGVFGFVKGLQWNEAKYQALVAKVEAEGRVAAEQAAIKTREAKEITKEISDEFDKSLATVRADYDKRLRDAYTAARRVPSATPPAPKPHERIEPREIPDLALRERIDTLEIEIAEIEKRLAEAAVQIEKWKEYGQKVIEWSNARPASGTPGSRL